LNQDSEEVVDNSEDLLRFAKAFPNLELLITQKAQTFRR
jgi:ABC-type uncharacterized transport system YnjBCD substrate-binding protein